MAGLALCCCQGTAGLTSGLLSSRCLGRRARNSGLREWQLSSRAASLSQSAVHLHEDGRLVGFFSQVRNGRRSITPMKMRAETSENDTVAQEKPSRAKDKVARRTADMRVKISDFIAQKSGLSWLLGPLVSTATIVIPATTMNLASLFQRNYLAGLAATFGLDILFVLSTDLFLVLANKLGHHQQVAGGPPPWIGPWEFTGYPEGFPNILNYVSYVSVGVAAMALAVLTLVGKLPAALATLAPYVALIFVQVVYERLMGDDRSPVSPLVPIVYTAYRFWQLTRGFMLLPFLEGGGMLKRFLLISASLWVFYLALYLTQLPWLYSTWNANKAT